MRLIDYICQCIINNYEETKSFVYNDEQYNLYYLNEKWVCVNSDGEVMTLYFINGCMYELIDNEPMFWYLYTLQQHILSVSKELM